MSKRILLVDDEQDILEFIEYNLLKEGFVVDTANNGAEAISIAKRNKPDLILLDVMMPELDGIETCREIRSTPELSNVLIAFLTARNEDFSQLAGFEVGADDYISKPIKPKLLISRIKALLRRKNNETEIGSDKSLKFGDIEVNYEQFIIRKGKRDIEMPRKEFELLALLLTKPGKVYTRQEILDKVWGVDVIVGDRTIDVHIRKIREKLGEELIKTVKGIGYKLDLL